MKGLLALGLWGWLWRLAVILWPLAVFAHHGRPDVLGWVVEVPWLVLVIAVWLGSQSTTRRR